MGSNPTGVAILHPSKVSWPSGLRRSTQVRVSIWRRGFESHWNHVSSGPVAQWIARLTSNQAVAGSSPARVVCFWLLVRGFPVGGPHAAVHAHTNGGLAQSVECVLCKHEAPGSKPGFSTFLFAREQWQVGRVVKAVDSKSTGLRPRQFESGTCRLSVCRFSIVVIAPAL